ncbi:MAG: helicase-related protein, partial [Candidatus Micrarchaeaceae archaeon]
HIESRTSSDEDVIAYVMPKYVHTVEIELDDTIKRIASLIRPVAEDSLRSLRGMGLLNFKNAESIPKGKLIQLGDEIKKISAQGYRFGAFFSYIKLLHAEHMYDLLTTEGLYPLKTYIDSLNSREHKSRAVESFVNNANIREASRIAGEAINRGEEHPKINALISILDMNKDKSAIVFVQYRATIKMIVDKLQQKGFAARAFVGKKEGVTQEQQKQAIADFRSGKFNVLVASSIGEEGLDIPSVDVVVFYEPIPNEIRNIQRKGRTGRFRAGDVFLLVAKGSKDEVYLFVSKSRERKMASLLSSVNKKLEARYAREQEPRQTTLS